MTRIFQTLGLAAISLFWLGSCKTVPENHYFTISYVLLDQYKAASKPFPVTLRVRPLEVSTAYDTDRIVYRYSPYEFRYYHYMLWASKPQKLVTDLLLRHLDHAGLFLDVSTEYPEHQPDYELSGVLHAIEELDSGDEWSASLSFVLRMTRFRDEKVVWSYQANGKKRVYNKAPVYVVKALSELMEAEMIVITNQLREFLASEIRLREVHP